MTVNFLNSDWFRRCIASSSRTTCPPRSCVREVNKSHVAVSMYQNIVTGENPPVTVFGYVLTTGSTDEAASIIFAY
jgi:hypothetical protein